MFYLLKITEHIFIYLQKNYNWQNHNKHSISSKGKRIKQILGAICAFMAIAILTGFDKTIEAELLKLTPEFITNISLSL